MTFRTRIVRVRPKRGLKVELLRAPISDDGMRSHIEDRVFRMLSVLPGEVAGFAFCTWNAKGGTTTGYSNWSNGSLPTPLVPELVRNCVQQRITEDRAREVMEGGR